MFIGLRRIKYTLYGLPAEKARAVNATLKIQVYKNAQKCKKRSQGGHFDLCDKNVTWPTVVTKSVGRSEIYAWLTYGLDCMSQIKTQRKSLLFW